MSDSRIRRTFERAGHPAPDLPRHRAALRRELVRAHGSTRPRRPGRRLLFYLPAAALAAALVVVLVAQSMPVTLASVLREMEEAYAPAPTAGGVQYLRQILSWSGEEEMETEQWWDPGRERFRMLFRSTRTGEILGHSISLSHELFAVEGSRYVARRLVRSAGPPDSGGNVREPVEVSRLAVIVQPPAGRPSPGEGKARLQALLVGDLDRGRFSRRTPREILDGIHEEPGLEYLGTEIDDAGGHLLHVLRSEPSLAARSAVLTFPAGRLAEVREIIADAGDLETGGALADPVEAILDSLAASGLEAQGVRVEPARVIRTYRVDAATSRIAKVAVTVTWGEAGRYAVSKRILADSMVDDAPSLFDPDLFGMVAVGAEDEAARSGAGAERGHPVPGGS